MNFAQFGIGVGALADGFKTGMEIGNQINTARDKREIRDIREGGLETAKQDYEAELDSKVTKFRPEISHGINGEFDLGYQVDGGGYADKDSARKAAAETTESVDDRFFRSVVPKISEAYMAQGDVEKAEAWNQYSERRDTKKKFKDWSENFQAFKQGNFDKAGKYIKDFYNSDVNDGITADSFEVVKDKEGNPTGMNVRLKNDETGEEYDQFIDREFMLNQGFGFLSPQNQFEMEYEQMVGAQKMRAEEAAKYREKDYNLKTNLVEEDIKQQNRTDLAATKANLDTRKERQQTQDKIAMLNQAGYSDEFINSVMPDLLGIDEASGMYRKPRSPQETIENMMQEKMKNDLSFKRKSLEERMQIIREEYAQIRGLAEDFGGRSPAREGLNPNAGGRQVWDNVTGQMITLP